LGLLNLIKKKGGKRERQGWKEGRNEGRKKERK
jgi:hypothetical protein